MTTQNVLTTNIGNRASTPRSRLLRVAAIAAFAAAMSACQAAPPASPTQMAHCSHVYSLWLRYLQSAMDQSGERARAEKTLFECQHGRYDTEELEAVVQNRGFPPVLVAGASPILPP